MTNEVDTFPYLFWGYTITWLLIVAYCMWLGARVNKCEKMLRSDKDRE